MYSRKQRFGLIVVGFVLIFCLFHYLLFQDLTDLDQADRPRQKEVVVIPPERTYQVSLSYTLDDSWSGEQALEKYRDFHHSALLCYTDPEFKKQHNECDELRFMTYRAASDGGFGNKVRAMMSTFLVAVLTGRVFLLDWTVPAHWSESLAPPEGIEWDFPALHRIAPEVGGRSVYSPNLQSVPLHQMFGDKSIILESNSPFFHQVYENPIYNEKLKKVFGASVGDTPNVWNIANGPIFETSLLNFMLRPSAQVANITNDIQLKFKGNYVIALHVRTWEGCSDFKCLHVFIDCGTKSAKKARQEGKNPIVFIAADRQDLVEELRSRFSENNIQILLYEHPIKHYVDAVNDGAELKNDILEKMMTDFYMIGEASLFLGTWYSSFSENAGLRTGLETWLFGRGPDQDPYPDWCKV